MQNPRAPATRPQGKVEESLMQFGPRHTFSSMYDLPSVGTHIIAEFYGCDTDTINDEMLLRDIMRDSIVAANATLLSLSSHAFAPIGVTALALLSESHLSIHTWPEYGYVATDMFTCGTSDTAAAMRVMETRMGCTPSATLWSMRARGGPYAERDLDRLLADAHVQKKLIVSRQSPYQRIDVYYVESRSSYWKGEGIVTFLDGVSQSASSDEYVYHEALVQPAMMIHPKPQKVLVVGGGEGATLRELLSHPSVTEAHMAELDPMMVDVAINYLDELHQGAFNNSRTRLHVGDGIQYIRDMPEGYFDVIILDLLDPEDSMLDNDDPDSMKPYDFQDSDYESTREKRGKERMIRRQAVDAEWEKANAERQSKMKAERKAAGKAKASSKKSVDPDDIFELDDGYSYLQEDFFDTPTEIFQFNKSQSLSARHRRKKGENSELSNPLYTTAFFKMVRSRLSKKGILVTHAGGLSLAEPMYANAPLPTLYKRLKGLFPSVYVYHTHVESFESTYPFVMSCRTIHCGLHRLDRRLRVPSAPINFINSRITQRLPEDPRMYDGEAHRNMFHLPPNLRTTFDGQVFIT
jgi:spermidine synthase